MASKIYTKTGDRGDTGLVDGTRVSKSHLRLECYGTIDELNSQLGWVRVALGEHKDLKNELDDALEWIQSDLFSLGSRLACSNPTVLQKLPTVSADRISKMEALMDRMDEALPALKNFILPGGCETASRLHIARTVCRRAERATVRLQENEGIESIAVTYLNRLSDLLFVMARFSNLKTGFSETVWKS